MQKQRWKDELFMFYSYFRERLYTCIFPVIMSKNKKQIKKMKQSLTKPEILYLLFCNFKSYYQYFNSIQFWDFPKISKFLKFLSLTSFGNSWHNSYIKSLSLNTKLCLGRSEMVWQGIPVVKRCKVWKYCDLGLKYCDLKNFYWLFTSLIMTEASDKRSILESSGKKLSLIKSIQFFSSLLFLIFEQKQAF